MLNRLSSFSLFAPKEKIFKKAKIYGIKPIKKEYNIPCFPFRDIGQDFKYYIMDCGYKTLNGAVTLYQDHLKDVVVALYLPSKKDILFKKFPTWKPPWMKQKEVLKRIFK